MMGVELSLFGEEKNHTLCRVLTQRGKNVVQSTPLFREHEDLGSPSDDVYLPVAVSDTNCTRVLSFGALGGDDSSSPTFNVGALCDAQDGPSGHNTSYLPTSDEDSDSQSVKRKNYEETHSPPSTRLKNGYKENNQSLAISQSISDTAPLGLPLPKNHPTKVEGQPVPGVSPRKASRGSLSNFLFTESSLSVGNEFEVKEVLERREAISQQEQGSPVCDNNDHAQDEESKSRFHLRLSPLSGAKGKCKKKALTERSQTEMKKSSSQTGSEESRRRKKLMETLTLSPRRCGYLASEEICPQQLQDVGDSVLKSGFANKGEASSKESKNNARASLKRSQEKFENSESKQEEGRTSKGVSACEEEGEGNARRNKSHSFSSKAVSFGERVRVMKIPTLSSALPSVFSPFSNPAHDSSSTSSSTRATPATACSSASVVGDSSRVPTLPITDTCQGGFSTPSPRIRHTRFSPRSPRELFKRLKSKDKMVASSKTAEDDTDGRYAT